MMLALLAAAALQDDGPFPDAAARFAKGRAIYRKFPPPEWGEQKRAEISKKGQLKLPVTETEIEFAAGFDLWKFYASFHGATTDEKLQLLAPYARPPTAEESAAFAHLVPQLDSDDLDERDAAEAKLRTIGLAILDLVRHTLARRLPLETRGRLQEVVDSLWDAMTDFGPE